MDDPAVTDAAPADAGSGWSLRAAVISYGTAWVCVALAWTSPGTPTPLVPLFCLAAAALLVGVEGRGPGSAIALATVGLACGWLYVAPALGACLHAATLSAEGRGMRLEGVAYGSALATSLGHQCLAALVGTLATPAGFAALSLLGPRRRPGQRRGRPGLVAPIHAAIAATIQAPAVFYALVPLSRSQRQLGERGGDVTMGLAAIAAVLGAHVALVVAAWTWVRQAWRARAEPASFCVTVLGTPLVSLFLWGMPVLVGLMAVQSLGAIVPLRGDAPPEGADPVILHALTRAWATWLLLGPVTLAVLWFAAAGARALGRVLRRAAGR